MTIKLRTRPVKGNIYIKRSNNTKYTIIKVSKHIDNESSYNLYTVEFINKDGWLVKRYLANQEITNIVVSNSIAGIIYRDKIEIVNL